MPRTTTKQTSHAESQAIKDAKIELFAGIHELNDHDLTALRTFLRILNAARGNHQTPIEDFIATLPHQWEYAEDNGFSLTPDNLLNMIEAPSDGVRQ
jgi:hypothetical protein